MRTTEEIMKAHAEAADAFWLHLDPGNTPFARRVAIMKGATLANYLGFAKIDLALMRVALKDRISA